MTVTDRHLCSLSWHLSVCRRHTVVDRPIVPESMAADRNCHRSGFKSATTSHSIGWFCECKWARRTSWQLICSITVIVDQLLTALRIGRQWTTNSLSAMSHLRQRRASLMRVEGSRVKVPSVTGHDARRVMTCCADASLVFQIASALFYKLRVFDTRQKRRCDIGLRSLLAPAQRRFASVVSMVATALNNLEK